MHTHTICKQVVLCGHSAGGWLGRAAMNDGVWDAAAGIASQDVVAGLVTLGSPHFPGTLLLHYIVIAAAAQTS
jgi:triacylglycerol esterase/lipase EstA (alpha/beta hydrolase family)